MELNWATVAYLVCGVGFVLSAIGLYYHSRRDAFDEWYSAQRKLEDEEERKKKQSKSGGKKKEKKSDSQTKQQKEESVKSEKKALVNEKTEEAVKEEAEGKNKKKSKKSNSISESKTEAPAKSAENKKPGAENKPDPVQRDRSPLKAKNVEHEFVEVKTKQQKKRDSTGKASPEPVQTAAPVIEVVKKIDCAPVKTASEKPKRRLEEMDVGKLLADMVSSMDTVHVQFLKNYVETVNKKEKASLAAVSTATGEKGDLLRQLTSQSQKIRSLEEALTQLQAQNSGLNEKVGHLVQKETFLNGELDKKTKEMVAFRSSADDILKVAEKSKHAVTDLQKRLEDAKTEVKAHSTRVAELEADLEKAKKLEATLDSIHTEWQQIKPSLSEKQAAQSEADTGALNTAHTQEIAALEKKHAAEITSVTQKHTAEKKELQEKLTEAMEQYLSIQELCNKLQNEVQNFEKMQAELNQKEEEVAKQKKTLAEINAAHNDLLSENLALRQQIEALNKKVTSASAQNGDLGEEINVKKSHELTSAPHGDSNLREENQRLKNKNEELRVRNFKLQEMFENHTAAPTSSKPAEFKPEPLETKKKDNKKSKKDEPKTNEASAKTTNSTEEPPIVKTYRDALLTLRSELDRMKDIHDEQKNHIQQLEAKVQNRSAPQKTKPIAAAVPVASELASKPAPKKGTSSTGSGEENDWELVY